MSKQNDSTPMVYVVITYGQIVGVFSSLDSASQVQREQISKNRPADCVVKPLFD